ncbi:MAG: hypothetical protein ABL902_01575 [Gallionella sp.]
MAWAWAGQTGVTTQAVPAALSCCPAGHWSTQLVAVASGTPA